MIAPSWLADGLAVAMLTVSAYCASRLVLTRLTHRTTNYSVDAVHTVMGVAMAGMLTSRLAGVSTWITIFVIAAGWFGVRAVGGAVKVRGGSVAVGSHLRHVVTSGAMVYMLVAAPTAAAASTPATTAMPHLRTVGGGVRFPTVALLLCMFMIGYTVMVMDRLSNPSQGRGSGDGTQVMAPRTVACCQVAMNITMGYMLVTMLG